MTREEELQILQDFIEQNGVTKLPPDTRGPDCLMSVWSKKKPSKRGRKKKVVEPKEKEE